MEVLSKSLSKADSEQLGDVVHGTVYCAGRDSKEHETEDPFQELLEILGNNTLDDASVDVSQPYTQVCANHKQT